MGAMGYPCDGKRNRQTTAEIGVKIEGDAINPACTKQFLLTGFAILLMSCSSSQPETQAPTEGTPSDLWRVYDERFKGAKYIDPIAFPIHF
jgi:hypothetical protein